MLKQPLHRLFPKHPVFGTALTLSALLVLSRIAYCAYVANAYPYMGHWTQTSCTPTQVIWTRSHDSCLSNAAGQTGNCFETPNALSGRWIWTHQEIPGQKPCPTLVVHGSYNDPTYRVTEAHSVP